MAYILAPRKNAKPLAGFYAATVTSFGEKVMAHLRGRQGYYFLHANIEDISLSCYGHVWYRKYFSNS